MSRPHRFSVAMSWSGPPTAPSSSRDSTWRDHVVYAPGKPDIAGSSAGAFHGDQSRWNPEELLIAALAQCHFLSYLYLLQREGIELTSYTDQAVGTLRTHPDGSGEMAEVVLSPTVHVALDSVEKATALHDQAHALCFIARSVAFPVRVVPAVRGV